MRAPSWSRICALLATMTLVVGCAQEARSPPREGVAPEVLLRCGDAIDRVDDLPGGYQELAGVAALPTGEGAAHALQTTDFGGPDPAARLFAKTGLAVRPGRELDLVVPPEYQDRVAVGWGSPGSPTHRLRVPPCEGDGAAWLVFAGGISVADPECIELDLVHGTAKQRFTMGVGAPCPGQQPPAGASDS